MSGFNRGVSKFSLLGYPLSSEKKMSQSLYQKFKSTYTHTFKNSYLIEGIGSSDFPQNRLRAGNCWKLLNHVMILAIVPLRLKCSNLHHTPFERCMKSSLFCYGKPRHHFHLIIIIIWWKWNWNLFFLIIFLCTNRNNKNYTHGDWILMCVQSIALPALQAFLWIARTAMRLPATPWPQFDSKLMNAFQWIPLGFAGGFLSSIISNKRGADLLAIDCRCCRCFNAF